MTETKVAATSLAACAGAISLVAGYFSLKAAKTPSDPGGFEPLDEAGKALYWTDWNMRVTSGASVPNMRAAWCALISGLVSIAASILAGLS